MSRSGIVFSEGQDLASACSLASDALMTDALAVVPMMDTTDRSGIVFSKGQDLASTCSLASDALMKDTLAVLLMIEATARFGSMAHEVQWTAVASASTVSLRPTSRTSQASTSSALHRTIETPNQSFNRTRNGMAPGPCSRLGHHRPHGPGNTPLRAG